MMPLMNARGDVLRPDAGRTTTFPPSPAFKRAKGYEESHVALLLVVFPFSEPCGPI